MSYEFETQSIEYYMRQALAQAQLAMDADEVPVGAVIERHGRIIAAAHNQCIALKERHRTRGNAGHYAGCSSSWRLATGRMHAVRDAGTLRHVRRCDGEFPSSQCGVRRVRSQRRSVWLTL